VVRLASDVAFLFKTDKTGLTLAATTLALCPASETVLLNVGVGDARSLYLAGLGAAGTIVITPVDNY
jgi:hypothetical protein